ncbi:MAG: YitT family protein [Pseudomonadota bacterium]
MNLTHPANPTPPRHSQFEDIQGLIFGSTMCAASVVILQQLGLVTGQIAGLALVISYATGWSFGAVFFALNAPFYGLALKRMGWRFTLRTVAGVALVSVLIEVLPGFLDLGQTNPWIGAALAGMMAAAGLLAIFRHGASLGGVGVLALYLQDQTGFRAGWTQLAFDALVFGLALLVLPLKAVLASLLGAAVLNVIIAINHRRDHYVAL